MVLVTLINGIHFGAQNRTGFPLVASKWKNSTLLENQSIFNNGKVSIFLVVVLFCYCPFIFQSQSQWHRQKTGCYWTVRSILKKPQMRGVYSLKDVRPRWAMGAHFCVPWLKWWSFHNGLGVLRWGDMDCKVDGILLLQARTNWCSKFSVARTWQIVFGVTSSIIIFSSWSNNCFGQLLLLLWTHRYSLATKSSREQKTDPAE